MKKIIVILVIFIALAFIIMTPNYSKLGFKEVKELDGMLERGGELVTSSILASAGLESKFTSYEGIGWNSSVIIEVGGKEIEGTYFGYNTQEGYHYVYLKSLLKGENVYKISDTNCEIYAN